MQTIQPTFLFKQVCEVTIDSIGVHHTCCDAKAMAWAICCLTDIWLSVREMSVCDGVLCGGRGGVKSAGYRANETVSAVPLYRLYLRELKI